MKELPLKYKERMKALLGKEFEDYELIVLSLQEKSFDAWKIDDDYSVIRVMNSDGEIALYQYDSVDGTLQRYAGLVAKETVEEVEDTEMSFMALLQKYYLLVWQLFR